MKNNNIEKVIDHLEKDEGFTFQASEELKKVLEEMMEGKLDPETALEKYLEETDRKE